MSNETCARVLMGHDTRPNVYAQRSWVSISYGPAEGHCCNAMMNDTLSTAPAEWKWVERRLRTKSDRCTQYACVVHTYV